MELIKVSVLTIIFAFTVEASASVNEEAKMASQPAAFALLFGAPGAPNKNIVNLINIIAAECDSYINRGVPLPNEELKQMCSFRALYHQQLETERYILSGPKELLLPKNLELESFRRGILALNYDFNERQVDGFALFAAYALRKKAMLSNLDSTLSLFKLWYRDSYYFQNYYWPSAKAAVAGGLPLTQLLRAGSELKCQSEYFSCRRLSGLTEQDTLAAYSWIVTAVAEIKAVLKEYPDTELAQVQKFRAKLNAALKTLNPTATDDHWFKKRFRELDEAVVEANSLFLETPPERIAKFFIALEQLDELTDVLLPMMADLKAPAPRTKPSASHFLLEDVYHLITHLNEEMKK